MDWFTKVQSVMPCVLIPRALRLNQLSIFDV